MPIKEALIKKIVGSVTNRLEKREEFLSRIELLESFMRSRYEMIDSHLHAFNFRGESEGLENLIYHMDKAGVRKSVIFGMPVRKMWSEYERSSPQYYLDDDSECYYDLSTDAMIALEYVALDEQDRQRLYPLICGFNPMDMNSIHHIRKMFELYPGVFRGIGEVLFRHDDLTFLTPGESCRINNRAMYPIFEFAVEYDLPVLVHNNITSPGVSDHPKYLHEMEMVLRDFPKLKMIFAHCGASRRIHSPNYRKMIERLLKEYPSLFVDFSWVIFDEFIMKDAASMYDWCELTEKYHDRILLGTDILGDGFQKIGMICHRFDAFLDRLPPDVVRDICIGNAERLYGNTKNAVESGRRRQFPSLDDIRDEPSLLDR